ncbi:MAG: LamG domain-containing protein [Kiritimatiellales bacterium]
MKNIIPLLALLFLSGSAALGRTVSYWSFNAYSIGYVEQALEPDTGVVSLLRGPSTSTYMDCSVSAGYHKTSGLYFAGKQVAFCGSATPLSTIELRSFTVEAFVCPEKTPSDKYSTLVRLSEIGDGEPELVMYELRLQETDAGLVFGMMFTDPLGRKQELNLFQDATIPLGEWTYVAASFDSAEKLMTLRVNGDVKTFECPFAPPRRLKNRSFTLGCSRSAGNVFKNPYSGNLDEVRISDAVLDSKDSLPEILK